MDKTVQAVVPPALHERWWWRWRWPLFLLSLLFYCLSPNVFPEAPLYEGYVGLFRRIAGGLLCFCIGYLLIRSVYRNVKSSTSSKLGCLFSLLRWVWVLKLFALSMFGVFVFTQDVFVKLQIMETSNYSIDGHRLVIACPKGDFDLNRSTAAKLAIEHPAALRITYWPSGVVKSVQFLPQEQAGHIVASCS